MSVKTKKKSLATPKTPQVKISPEDLAYARNIFTTDMHQFCDYFLKDDEAHGFAVPTRGNRIQKEVPQFQRELFAELVKLKETRRLVLASPRGFCKSTTCSIFFPLFAIHSGMFSEILLVSNSEALAIQLLRQVKTNLESNMELRINFGALESEKWTETHIITKNGVSIRACGWGAQVRGFRPDLIIIDDIESDETVKSEEITAKIKDWILGAAINALTTDGCFLMVGTVIRRTALMAEFVNNPPQGWKTIFNQAYRGGIMEPGHELWPEEKPHEWLQMKRSEIGSARFSAEYMNDPLPADGNCFNPASFRYFTDADLEGKKLGMYITVDPAFSDQGDSDFGVIMQCLHDEKDNLYVDRYFHKRTTTGELISYLKNLYLANRGMIRAIGVEKNGPQKAFYDDLKRQFASDSRLISAPFVELTGSINGVRNKKDRITFTLQPRLEAGKIYFRKEQRELIDELTLYPEVKHDDLCDALAYQWAVVPAQMSYEQDLYAGDYEVVSIGARGVTGYGDDYAAQA